MTKVHFMMILTDSAIDNQAVPAPHLLGYKSNIPQWLATLVGDIVNELTREQEQCSSALEGPRKVCVDVWPDSGDEWQDWSLSFWWGSQWGLTTTQWRGVGGWCVFGATLSPPELCSRQCSEAHVVSGIELTTHDMITWQTCTQSDPPQHMFKGGKIVLLLTIRLQG